MVPTPGVIKEGPFLKCVKIIIMVKVVIEGKLLSKSNSRIITSWGGRPRLIKRPEAIHYVESALMQLKQQLRGHETFLEPVRLDATVFYKDKRPDLDISLTMDVLEKAGVYKNDRQVYEFHAYKKFDKENPRLEAIIQEI